MVDVSVRPPRRELRPQPTAAQRRAADPAASAWVTASAGTGKTRVLADRVLRLLLAGAMPARILCLTFTKAAAAEMVSRIQHDLGRFATWGNRDLEGELQRLLGRAPSPPEITRARILLPEVLDLPAGLPVMTIHGFCQTLLQRFPLEAGVPPQFAVIEQRDAGDLLRQAQEEVLSTAAGPVQEALRSLAVVLGEAGLRAGLAALNEDRLRLHDLFGRCGDLEAVIERVRAALGVAPGMSLERLRAQVCADPRLDLPGLREACRALGTGSAIERERALVIAAWLAADPERRIASFESYRGAFYGKDGKLLARLITKGASAIGPGSEAALQAEQGRLEAAVALQRQLTVLERTAAVLRVGAAVIERYERRKARDAVLDFDDLIARARDLLERPGMSSWVSYKLDQQIDHLLVDEGQDTSPEQWAIVEALTGEFFAGEGARGGGRTLFVVGDPKQSIFSFQGADLATFQRLHERFGALAKAARAPWREEPLTRSFRSARPVLDVVDAVFAGEPARDGVVSGPEPLRHETAREAAPGSVEVWPLIEVEPPARPTSWQLPDRHEPFDRAEHCTARLITRRILQWRNDPAPLPSTGKPLQPGDVMVLLPRRGVLQDLLVRELKRHNVPVAGADRLALIDEIAVMDLMALGHALLLPDDDLTLAAALKSPLFGLSEEDLFDLAWDRGGASLHARLRERHEDRPVLGAAWRRLRELSRLADTLPPFEFYARLLGVGGGRRQLLARLGEAALEPIEAFLAQALAYERTHPPSLQGFLHWLGADTTELVRDPDRPRDEVRVLTVHGAKGLEAPVVFLADTTFVPAVRDRLLWADPEGLPLWRVGKALQDGLSRRADEHARARELQENRRLLYVAMTRARDHLVVTGWKRERQSEPSWYDLVAAARERLQGVEPLRVPDLEGHGWRYADRRGAAPAQRSLALTMPRGEPQPPAWLRRPPPEEPASGATLSPSRLGDGTAAPSPASAAEAARFLRGRLIHRLLQMLPDRPPEAWDEVMARYLAQPGFALGAGAQKEIAAEVRAVMTAPGFGRAFAPGSRPEVPLAGTVAGQPFAGQVDRLAVTDDEVLVIDFKTNREPPPGPAEVPLLYWRQMAAYRALLRRIYPSRPVRCALLWTRGPNLMALDATALDQHDPARSRP